MVALVLQLNRTYDARMFYFFFEAAKEAEEAPLVVWMTGAAAVTDSSYAIVELHIKDFIIIAGVLL